MDTEWLERQIAESLRDQNTDRILALLATWLCQRSTYAALATVFQVFKGCGQDALAATLASYARHLFPGFAPAATLSLPPPSAGSLRFWRRWLQPAQPPRVSVCMIVRNEEALLPRALESVIALADEIILVDTGSEDQTIALARHLSEKVCVFQIPWADDFAAARNFSLEQASGDWIFCLDGDEYLSDETRLILKAFLAWPPIGLNVFNLWQFNERGPDDYERQPIERLFPSTPLLRFFGRLHEQLVCTDLACSPGNFLLHGTALFNPLTSERCDLQQKRKRIDILYTALREPEQNTPYLNFHFGWHLMYVATPPDLPQALQILQHCLAESLRYRGQRRPTWYWSPAPLDMTCLLIVDALQRLNEHQRLCAIFESWPTLTHFAETWFRYARSSQICGQTARARLIFQRLRQGEFRALTTREGCESWRAGLELIRLALLEHQPAEAFALWPQIAAEIPGNQRQTLQMLRDSLERLQAIAHTDHRSSI